MPGHRRRSIAPRGMPCLLAALALSVSAGVRADDPVELPTVEVVGTTPLPGLGVRIDQIPAPVQTAKSPAILRSNAIELPGFMNRFLGGVFVNDIQGNPFQPDVTYRGYTASPLLGHAAGAVGLHGRRAAQPTFRRRRELGLDSADRDLVDRAAAGLQPPVRPQHAGRRAVDRNQVGAHRARYERRRPATAQYNRASAAVPDRAAAWENGVDAFATGNLFNEDGWRDDSPSRIGQLFAQGRLARLRDNDRVADAAPTPTTDLTGNGLQEQRFLARDYASVYTKPDDTNNQSMFVNLVGEPGGERRRARCRATCSIGEIKTSTLNGDINDDSLDQAVYQPNAAEQAALAAAGYTGFPTSGENASNTPFPFWRCIANALLNERAEREVQRAAQPHQHVAVELGRIRTGHVRAAARRRAQSVRRRRVVRRESHPLHAVVAIRLPHAGSRSHRGRTRSPTARRTRRTRSTRASTSTARRSTSSVFATDTSRSAAR